MKENLFDRPAMAQAWAGFKPGRWSETIDVRDFIQRNYTPYYGDESFLAGRTARTAELWNQVNSLIKKRCGAGP